MTVKHWNTGASAERYRAGKRASEHKEKITILWGSDKAPENKETYTFDNKEQLDYFMMGDSADLKEKIELALDDK